MLTLEELDRILKASHSADPAKQETQNKEPAHKESREPVPTDPENYATGPHDAQAKAAGWLILTPGEVYEYPLSRTHSVYLFHEKNDHWTAWRASWFSGKSTPDKEKTMADAVPWVVAWTKANEYIQWFQTRPA